MRGLFLLFTAVKNKRRKYSRVPDNINNIERLYAQINWLDVLHLYHFVSVPCFSCSLLKCLQFTTFLRSTCRHVVGVVIQLQFCYNLGTEATLLGVRQGLGSNKYANLMRTSFQLSYTRCFPVALLLVPLLQNRYH